MIENNNADSDLLKPSLDGEKSDFQPLYSTTAGYVSALMGGPIASAFLILVNSHRLKRIKHDWPIAAIALLAMVAYLAWVTVGGGQAWLVERMGRSATRYGVTALGLLVFALGHLAHGKFYRAMNTMGVESPSGWGMGVAAIALGVASNFLIIFLLNQ
jgi:hypothetical protein